jgi:hypothetical protein
MGWMLQRSGGRSMNIINVLALVSYAVMMAHAFLEVPL